MPFAGAWVGWLVPCLTFTSWRLPRSYQDGYRLVTVHTFGDLIVLPHLEIRLPVTLFSVTQSLYSHTEPTGLFLILIMPSTWLGSD